MGNVSCIIILSHPQIPTNNIAGGGKGWTGPTACVSGSCCNYQNEYYSQCTPTCAGGGGVKTSTTVAQTTSRTSQPSSNTSKPPVSGGDVAFNSRVVFTPPSNYKSPKVLYARSVMLSNGDLLATWYASLSFEMLIFSDF